MAGFAEYFNYEKKKSILKSYENIIIQDQKDNESI